ncbi:MAG: hypothetical protein AB7P22_09385 [Vicinamibacterales bacterium]
MSIPAGDKPPVVDDIVDVSVAMPCLNGREARAAGTRVVDVPERGYGDALRGSIQAPRGRHVVMSDADDSCDLLDVRQHQMVVFRRHR